MLRNGYKNIKIQILKAEQQQRKLDKEVAEACQNVNQSGKNLRSKKKAEWNFQKPYFLHEKNPKNSTSQLDSIDAELTVLDKEYDETERLINQLQLSMETNQLRLQQLQGQLRQLGYEQPLETNMRQVEEAETTIRMMQFEIESIGAVNQLALSHYSDQISRYRELSVRLNELEREKQAIVQFMDEIEAKKRKVFMTAFEKISTSLKVYFSKLTGGGRSHT